MSLPISEPLRTSGAILALLALAACSRGGEAEPGESGGTAAESGVEAAGAAAETAPCALAGARTFTAQCTVERSQVDGRTILTVRHPDGGFRRLVALEGGKGYAAADGSEEAHLEANGAEIEVTLGDDHYLLPGPGPADAAKR